MLPKHDFILIYRYCIMQYKNKLDHTWRSCCCEISGFRIFFLWCSVTVQIGPRDYWSKRMSEMTGKRHRILFDETLRKIYNKLYTEASLTPWLFIFISLICFNPWIYKFIHCAKIVDLYRACVELWKVRFIWNTLTGVACLCFAGQYWCWI